MDIRNSISQGASAAYTGLKKGAALVQGVTLGISALAQGIIGTIGILFVATGKSLNPLGPEREGNLLERSYKILEESAETCIDPAKRTTLLALGTFSATGSWTYSDTFKISYPSIESIAGKDNSPYKLHAIDPLLWGTGLFGLSGRPEVTINVLERQIKKLKQECKELKEQTETQPDLSNEETPLHPNEERLFKRIDPDKMEDPQFTRETSSQDRIDKLTEQRAALKDFKDALTIQLATKKKTE